MNASDVSGKQTINKKMSDARTSIRNSHFVMILALAGLVLCCYACQPLQNKTIVSISGDQWQINGKPVLAGSPAQGLLVNARMVNAVFEDSGPAAMEHLPANFDPDKSTERFISQIPDYYNHGVRAFTI